MSHGILFSITASRHADRSRRGRATDGPADGNAAARRTASQKSNKHRGSARIGTRHPIGRLASTATSEGLTTPRDPRLDRGKSTGLLWNRYRRDERANRRAETGGESGGWWRAEAGQRRVVTGHRGLAKPGVIHLSFGLDLVGVRPLGFPLTRRRSLLLKIVVHRITSRPRR